MTATEREGERVAGAFRGLGVIRSLGGLYGRDAKRVPLPEPNHAKKVASISIDLSVGKH